MVGNKTLRERVVLSINYKQMPAKITRVDEITSCTQFGNTQIRLNYVSTLDDYFSLFSIRHITE